MPKGVPKPQRIEVAVDEDEVVAFVLASRERQIAVRSWLLDLDQGIVITCKCEKGLECEETNMVMRPSEWWPLEEQLLEEIKKLRLEYGLPAKKVKFNQVVNRDFVPVRKFVLYGLWKDEDALRQARRAFEATYR